MQQVKHALIRQVAGLLQSPHLGNSGPRSGSDQRLAAANTLPIQVQCSSRIERHLTKPDRDVPRVDLFTFGHPANHPLHIRRDFSHINTQAGRRQPEFCRVLRLLYHPRHVNQALTWHAAITQAVSSQLVLIDEQHLRTKRCGHSGRRQSTRSATYDRHIVTLHPVLLVSTQLNRILSHHSYEQRRIATYRHYYKWGTLAQLQLSYSTRP